MNIFYFNDLGEYNEYNPSFYLDGEYAKDLIKYIAKNPYSFDDDNILY